MSVLWPEGTMKAVYNFAPIERLLRRSNTHASFDVHFNQMSQAGATYRLLSHTQH